MFCQVLSGDVYGLKPRMIQIEADISDGLPIFNMVGYLASAVKEAKERVRSSMRNAGVRFPAKRITVNLSPADVRKDGTNFDLPIAISLLAAFGYLPGQEQEWNDTIILGELGLDGRVRPIHGVLSILSHAKECRIKRCIIPYDNYGEARLVEGVEIIPARSLHECMRYLRGEVELAVPEIHPVEEVNSEEEKNDFYDIVGQSAAKRAMEIAAAGRHNIFLLGPPGTGKTMLAKCLPGIMPPLSYQEQLEVTKIYSICGMLKEKEFLLHRRPFRSPHHLVTAKAMIGGGNPPHPGEITLANKGVLFMDEFLEFRRESIELLRQPLEERKIMITRVGGAFEYPSDFMLVAAGNICPCGQFPDISKCTCSETQRKKYISKLSEPILDRMDLCAWMKNVRDEKTVREHSRDVRIRVEQATKIQRIRYQNETYEFNGQMCAKDVQRFCRLGREEEELFEYLTHSNGMSMRGKHRVLKVARTIADLDGAETITEEQLGEAFRYRGLELTPQG